MDFQYSTPKTEHHATHVHAKQERALLTSLVTAILVVYIVLECVCVQVGAVACGDGQDSFTGNFLYL